MFSTGKHFVRWTIASRVQSLVLAVKDSTTHHQTVCRCYGNSCHRIIFHHRDRLHLSVVRNGFSARLGKDPHPHHRLGPISSRQTRGTVFLRSLSSESDSSEKTSSHIDLVEEDSFEEVVKELDAEGTGQRKSRKGKASSDSSKNSQYSMVSVGRLVPDKIVSLLDEDGESLGSLHRMEAIKRSQQAGLKLVLINPNTQPYPTYRLMTGQQLYQEQMLLREKRKTRIAPIQVKEARLSGNIAQHDLDVKRRHIHDWFKEGGAHVHVRVIVMGAKQRQKPVTKEQQMAVIHQLMSGLEDRVTFMSKPRDIGKDGMNVMVILRPMSAKEKAALVKQRNKEESLKQQAGVPEGEGVEKTDDTRGEKVEE